MLFSIVHFGFGLDDLGMWLAPSKAFQPRADELPSRWFEVAFTLSLGVAVKRFEYSSRAASLKAWFRGS